MITAPPKELTSEQLAKAAADAAARQKAGIAAMAEAWKGEEAHGPSPLTMEQAAAAVTRLRRERDTARAQKLSAEDKVTEERNSVRFALSGFPGSPGDFPALRAEFDRMASELQDARQRLATVAEGAKETFALLALTAVPQAAGLFADVGSPVLRAVEAAALLTAKPADDNARQAYLRRRGWIWTGQGGWRDPRDPNTRYPFASAFAVQARRDAEPFAGLGTKEWWHKGRPKEAQPQAAPEPEPDKPPKPDRFNEVA